MATEVLVNRWIEANGLGNYQASARQLYGIIRLPEARACGLSPVLLGSLPGASIPVAGGQGQRQAALSARRRAKEAVHRSRRCLHEAAGTHIRQR